MQQKRECARFNEEKKRAAWETVNRKHDYLIKKNILNKNLSKFKE